MEALKVAGLTPLSVFCEKRKEPRKSLSFSCVSPLKSSNSASLRTHSSSFQYCLSDTLNGSLVVLYSALIGTGLAEALTYEEALQQSTSVSKLDANGVLNNVINFATENPILMAGGAVVLAVPLILSQVLKKPNSWGVESAKKTYALLGDDANAQLLDIRPPVELRKVGSPDIKGFKKKPVSTAYKGEDKPGFLKKLSSKFKQPENTTLFILDKYDGNSELVAELVALNGFKAAYAIKDGAEGPRGWMNSGLPWVAPSKALSFDLSSFTDAFSIGDESDTLPVTIGIAAAAGLGALAFSEVETILQLLGLVATIQFASKKLLDAEDRKQTLEQVDEFLNTKVAPQELVSDIKEIGKALLPVTATTIALPAPAESSSKPATTAVNKAQSGAEPTPQINSVKAESVSGSSRPLSPYTSYPDLKPPTSPTPSPP